MLRVVVFVFAMAACGGPKSHDLADGGTDGGAPPTRDDAAERVDDAGRDAADGSATCIPPEPECPGCTAMQSCSYSDGSCLPGCGDGVHHCGEGWTCDPRTRRCGHSSGGGHAGDACETALDCEEDGVCVSGETPSGGWDRSCSKEACNRPCRACDSPDSVCQLDERGVGWCRRGCIVGAEAATPELVVGRGGHGAGCRPGFRCDWGGELGAGVTGNGGCVWGTYNDIREPDLGAWCEVVQFGTSCWSPFGAGSCLVGGGGWYGYCTVSDCDAPGMPADVCGSHGVCRALPGLADSIAIAICLRSCEVPADCRDLQACVAETDLGGAADSPGRVCLGWCVRDSDCRDGERCVELGGEPHPVCRPTP